ncbi:unnamed protein product, partial [Tetraodon nigroviridis]
GDLQSLSWLTSVDVPRLQQMADSRGHTNGPSQGSLLEQQTGPLSSITMSAAQSSMLHLQSNMQHSPLGVSIINTHSGSVSFQPDEKKEICSDDIFEASDCQICFSDVSVLHQRAALPRVPVSHHSLPADTPAGVLTHPNWTTVHNWWDLQQRLIQQPKFIHTTSPGSARTRSAAEDLPQAHLFVQVRQSVMHEPVSKSSQARSNECLFYVSCLIAMALKNSKTGSLPVSEIYSFMKEHFPYFKTAPDGWKNSVRHNLSLNKCFEKVENKTSSSSRKGCLWALNPAKIDKMEEEMQKWKRKDLPAIRRSMANPDELDKLITDRPESCRRKALEPGMTRLPGCPTGLPLPIPAQPTLRPLLSTRFRTFATILSPKQPGKPPDDFYGVHGDTAHTEVDALDPSIMDFALQGNLWEEMKDDSFNLDALGTLSNSPLRLSDCDLGGAALPPISTGASMPLSDVHVTGLYTSYP